MNRTTSNNGWLRQARLVAPIVAILAIAFTTRGQSPQEELPDLPEGITKVTKDNLLNKVPNFFCFDYPYNPSPRKRLWLVELSRINLHVRTAGVY